MKYFLREKLREQFQINDELTHWEYMEDLNKDVLTGDWLENQTSYIFRVGVLCAIDANKCDWVYIAIGTQRSSGVDEKELKGMFHFQHGENDDMGRVIKRAYDCLQLMHPAFDNH